MPLAARTGWYAGRGWLRRGLLSGGPIAGLILTGLSMAAVAAEVDRAAVADHWAFQPVKAVAPPLPAGQHWPWTETDRFLLVALERAGLAPVADAEPAALLRRVYLDLTGLPPEPADIEAFLAVPSRERLLATVDRLLDSPRFGERWGRHWLDVARYAESSGKETDFAYPHAWRYRDYVIQACNDDLPFDRFITEQLAGDLLEAPEDPERARLLIATGLLAVGPKSHVERNRLQFEMDLVDEQIDTVSQAFLGLTIACARCHDHKYDPISQRDYTALAGVFRSSDTRYGTIRILQNANPGDLVELPRSARQPDGVSPLEPRERRLIERQLEDLQERLVAFRRGNQSNLGQAVQMRVRQATLAGRLDDYEADGSPRQFAMCVLEEDRPRDAEFFDRGEVDEPRGLVPRGLPEIAGSAGDELSGSGREALARWIASADNPLTARVIVNRVWLHLFGRGLVVTPDNFGLAGTAPSHPELLDHLAATFVADGWSIKRLIRRLMASHAYALSTARDERAFSADPDNTLRWRMTPRRLDAEVIRDAILSTAGTLDLDPPLGSTLVAYGEGFVAAALRGRGRPLDETIFKRAVYLPAVRGTPLEALAIFDMNVGNLVTGQRPETVVPAQSLYLLNNAFVLEQAAAAAARLCGDVPADADRVRLAFLRWFGRPANSEEVASALQFVTGHDVPSAGWAAFCQALWASQEFLSRH